MRFLLAIAALACVAQGHHVDDLMDQLDAFDMKLARLTTNAVTGYDKAKIMADTRVKADRAAAVLNMLLDKKFGTYCEEGQFQCGTSTECVWNILVCDGANDCANNADESEDVCALPMKVGDKYKLVQFTGTGRSCFDPMESGTFTVTGFESLAYFPSRLRMSYSFDVTFRVKNGFRRRIYTGSGLYSQSEGMLTIDRGNTPTDDKVKFGERGNFVYRIFRTGETVPCETYFGLKQ